MKISSPLQLIIVMFSTFSTIQSMEIVQFNPILAGAMALQAVAGVTLEYPLLCPKGHIKLANTKISYNRIIGGSLSTLAAALVLSKQQDMCLKEIGATTIIAATLHILHSPWSTELHISSIAKNSATLFAPFIVHEAVTKHIILNHLWKFIFKPLLTAPSAS